MITTYANFFKTKPLRWTKIAYLLFFNLVLVDIYDSQRQNHWSVAIQNTEIKM